MAADWGLLAKSAVSFVFTFGASATTGGLGESLVKGVASGASTWFGSFLEKRVNSRLNANEQGAFDAAVDAAEERITAYAKDKNFSVEDRQLALDALLPLLSKAALSSQRQIASGYDTAKLASDIVNEHPRVKGALTSGQLDLCKELLTIGLDAALAQPELLTASEAAFRAAVLAGFHNLPRELHDFALDLQAAALLEPPQSKSFTGRAFQATSTLLDARFGDLPLVGRDELLADFDRWREDGDGAHVRLIIGPGGAGKTRLAMELCRRAAAAGWRAGVLAPPDRTTDIPAEAWDRLADFAPALIVVDYAENRAEDLRRLAAAAVLRHGPGAAKLRLALLARGAGEWWENRKSIADRDAAEFLSGPTVQAAAIDLEKLPAPAAGPIFTAAAAAFAKALAIDIPPAALDLTAAIFRLPLFVRIAALAAVEAQPAAKTETGLLDWALEREDRLTAQYGGYPEDRDKRAVADAAALATLTGGAPDCDGALALLRRLRDYAQETEERYLDWLKRLHPGPGELNPLTPDRLGEHLTDRQLTKAGDGGGKLLAAALGDAATADEKAHALTVLVRLASAAPDRGAKWLNAALSRFKDGLEAAALASVFGLPKQTLALREVALALYQLALEAARRAAPQPDDIEHQNLIAGLANNLAHRLSDLGRREEALDASIEAAEIYRQLAEQRPDAFRPYLAASLNNLANALSDLGRREEALDASIEAAEIYRQLAEQRPDAFRPDLAMSLNNLASRLSSLGQKEKALKTSKEAVSIRRQLAKQRPDAFKPDLAESLNNLASRLADLGRREEALDASIEAAEIYRQLAEQRPDAFKPDLAGSLNNLASRLSSLGQKEKALKTSKEAVSIRRQLAKQRPDAFKPDLAESLNNLASRLADLGRREEALEAILEAVGIRRQLAEQRPDVFTVNLARSLGAQGRVLQGAARKAEAAAAFAEGLRLILPYARRYGPALAKLTSALHQFWLETEPAPDEALLDEAADFLKPFRPPTDGAEG